MTEQGHTIIEPGIGGCRSADIDADGLPTDLRFHDDVSLSPMDAVFAARITKIDSTNDMAFADLGGGHTGALNLRRAKLLAKGAASINDCVTEGQNLLVQVVAEPNALDDKALTITPRPRLMGRYLVAEFGASRLNFSKDLGPKTVKALQTPLGVHAENAALVVRTTAADAPVDAVVAEAARLTKALAHTPASPELVFTYTPLEKALLAAPNDTAEIQIEGGSTFAQAKALAKTHWPDLADRLAAYKGTEAAFEHYGVNETIDEALSDRIDLPSGGWISITETAAMTVVDVNMGSALRGMSASQAKVVVNLEAALAALFHLRFQDIGGLVVIDFIDMSAKGAARDLMQLIEKTARTDRVPLSHTGLSTFGLVEFARKRSGVSLKGRMQVAGRPRRRASAVALDLLRRGAQVGTSAETGTLIVSGPEPVLGWIKRNERFLDELKTQSHRDVELLLGSEPDVFLRSSS